MSISISVDYNHITANLIWHKTKLQYLFQTSGGAKACYVTETLSDFSRSAFVKWKRDTEKVDVVIRI